MNDATFLAAFDNLMALEGGKTTDHAGPTNYGITLRNLQDSGDMDFDLNHNGALDREDLWTFSRDDARVYVYRHWWASVGLDKIGSPIVASKMLDVLYNVGTPRGVRMLQAACNRFGSALDIDGKLGPATLEAVNRINGASLVAALRDEQAAWYQYLIRSNPARFKRYERGWMRRAQT
jgi:type VI secretion system secreted protein VgrG